MIFCNFEYYFLVNCYCFDLSCLLVSAIDQLYYKTALYFHFIQSTSLLWGLLTNRIRGFSLADKTWFFNQWAIRERFLIISLDKLSFYIYKKYNQIHFTLSIMNKINYYTKNRFLCDRQSKVFLSINPLLQGSLLSESSF